MTAEYAAVLFDMDGVVVETEGAVTRFWQRFAAQHGVTLSEEDLQRHVYGRTADRTLDALFSHLSADDRHAVHAVMQQSEVEDTYHPLPGVIALLQALREAGVPTALVTSGGPWKVNVVLDQLGITDLLPARITANDISEGKPHPQCYLLAACKLCLSPGQCLVFEDAVSGVEAAVAAGATCIGVAPDSRASALREVGARDVVAGFSDVSYRDGALNLGNGTILSLSPGNRRVET